VRKIAILLVFLIGVFGCGASDISRHLESNKAMLDFENPDLSLIMEDLDRSLVVLGGEYHAVKANYSAQYGFLTALHQQAGFRYYLCEMGYGVAGLLNIYLLTGDTAILDRILQGLKGSAAWTEEFLEFWQQLYAYNRQLPEQERIIVVGVDIDWQVGPAVDYLMTLGGVEQLALLGDIYSLQSDEFPGFIKSIAQDMEENPDLYVTALGDNMFDFEMVINSLATLVAYHEDREGGMHLREQGMYENFVKIYNHYPPGKFFGQFGMAHVYQEQCSDGMEGVERFAMALTRNDSPVKGRVLSIAYVYVNSKMCSWQNNYQAIPVEKVFPDTRPLEKLAKSEFTLFRLTGEDSPFVSKAHMIPGPYRGVTTDYFQYILAIRNSAAATPFGPIE